MSVSFVVYDFLKDCAISDMLQDFFRLILVRGLKWVDEVIVNTPYDINENFLNTLFNEYKIDYIIHGDDPCLLPDGTDAYGLAKRAGRYKQIKRTEGVSSTDIVGSAVHPFTLKLLLSPIDSSFIC